MKTFNGRLEDTVLRMLFKQGAISTVEIVSNCNATKQGVYRVLRKLKAEEKITIYKSMVSVNLLWVHQLSDLLQRVGKSTSLVGNFSELANGEKVSFKIKTLNHYDQVWSDIFFDIEKTVKPETDLYLYNPHNWSFLLREKTDKLHLDRLSSKNRKTYLIVGSDTDAELLIKRQMQSEALRYSINKRIKEDKYIATIGDFIIRSKFSSVTNSRIDKSFKVISDIDELKTELFEIDKTALTKIEVERNYGKAKALVKKFSKDFK